MSEIAIQAPVVTGPPEIQPAGGQALPQGQPPVLQPPPLRTPQEVLAESRQRFPQADERVLRGEMGIPGPTNRQLDLLEGLSRHPLEGLAPVFIGQGRDFKAALMPTAGVPGPNPGLTIQLYVKEGEALYKRIMNGDEAVPHGKDEVAKVMWFLQALGSAKASESSGRRPPAPALFKAGAFSLEDPGRRLERFLTAANSYERKSSHLDAFQGHPGCQPRGVDIRGVPMPHERQTVLFARMPGANEVHNTAAPNMGPKGMLFLKMEEHGCRGLSLKGTGRAGEGPPSGLKKASRFFANIRDWLGHAFNFIGSLRRRNGLEGQDNRERIPGGVKTLYADLQNGAKALGQGFENLLNRDDPLSKTGGLRVMIRNLEDLRAQFQARPELRAQEPFAAFGPRLDDAVTLLRNRGDHPELRIGNEIILTSEEMTVGQPVPLLRPNQPFTQEGTIDPPSREVLLAGYRYVLANIDQRDGVEQFEKDANRDTYRVGPSGAETKIDQDAPAARAAVLALADGDERIAKALMTLAHQGLAEPIATPMTAHGVKNLQVMITPNNAGGDLHISRQPDAPGGAKVFRVGYTFDGPMSKDGKLAVVGKSDLVAINQTQSRVSGQIWLEVTCQPNGVMEPRFHGEPAYAFTFVPATEH